ncbi:MAG: N-acetylmuramoyl-L-alanine amidase-like domain-containing protein [Bacteriovoracia bacterium]
MAKKTKRVVKRKKTVIRPKTKKRKTSKRKALHVFSQIYKDFIAFYKACWKAWYKTWSSPKFSRVTWLGASAAVIGVLLLGILVKSGPQFHTVIKDHQLSKLFKQSENLPTNERVAFWSHQLMKNPRLLSSLEPGPKIDDSAPVFPQKYDCTTFVETIGGLVKSTDGSDLSHQIVSIRYLKGRTAYLYRNHFPEADWIPNNERAGNLKDITVSLAGKAGIVASWVHKDINKLAWFKKQHVDVDLRSLASSDTVPVELPYLPLNKLSKALKSIPQGSIVNIVRKDSSKMPVLISHQGFLIWKEGQPYFRHASNGHEIAEVPFLTYMEKVQRSSRWKVLGINVNQFNGS